MSTENVHRFTEASLAHEPCSGCGERRDAHRITDAGEILCPPDERITYNKPTCAFVYDMTIPLGRTLRDHLRGDANVDVTATEGPVDGGPHWGFEHFLLWLANNSKGFRVLVVSRYVAALLEHVFGLDLNLLRTCSAARGPTRVGSWRGHDLYVQDLPPDRNEGGYLAATVDGPKLGVFDILNTHPTIL